MYQPVLGAFTSRDSLPETGPVLFGPFAFGPKHRTSDNSWPYGYVDNNPINYVDPSGLKKCKLPPKELLDIMKEVLKDTGWEDKDGRISLATVACVACVESDYNPCAKSKADAIGIMQLTKDGWGQCIKDSAKSGIPKDAPYDPDNNDCCKPERNPAPECSRCPDAWSWNLNMRCGIYVLKYCRDKVKRKVTLEEILSCYNSGGYTPKTTETKEYIEKIKDCIPDMQTQLTAAGKK